MAPHGGIRRSRECTLAAATFLLLLLVSACGSISVVTTTVPSDRGDARGAHSCGVERWAVKTGTDSLASRVRLAPRWTTVALLDEVRAPRNPTSRVAPIETGVWQLHATVVAIKEEADSDYHLALSDGQGHSMIAEAPDPACAAGSVFAAQIRQARAAINAACPTVGTAYASVRIRAVLAGVGFFDRIHGQRGVAPNGVELHPLLAVSLQGTC